MRNLCQRGTHSPLSGVSESKEGRGKIMSIQDWPARIRAERKKRKWTQQQLADKAGMSLRAVQTFEGRKATPQPENLRAMRAALDLDGDDAEVSTTGHPEWPTDIDTFLNMMGAYLLYAVPEDQRTEAIHDITRQIFQSH